VVAEASDLAVVFRLVQAVVKASGPAAVFRLAQAVDWRLIVTGQEASIPAQ
jgi:hypothetical protein